MAYIAEFFCSSDNQTYTAEIDAESRDEAWELAEAMRDYDETITDLYED